MKSTYILLKKYGRFSEKYLRFYFIVVKCGVKKVVQRAQKHYY